MEIRYMKDTDDRYAISRIYEHSWKYAYREIIPQDYLENITPGKWVSHLNNTEMHTIVALDDNEFIGTASYCKSRFPDLTDFGEIVSLYLLPDYIGKGYGNKLMKTVIDKMARLGYRKIFLWILEDNKKARAFYEKTGFVSGERFLCDEIGGKKLREILYCYHMEK